MQCNKQCNTEREEKAILLKDQEDLKAFQIQVHIEKNSTFMAPRTVHVSPNVREHDKAELSIEIIHDTLKRHPLESHPLTVIGKQTALLCSEGTV